jgi:hypothetical protein
MLVFDIIKNTINIGRIMRNHDIKIKWSKPYPFKKVFEYEVVDERGLYCISRIFGANESIIYIGMATNTFRERLVSHKNNWIDSYSGCKLVRLGRIIGRRFENQIVRDAENALIFELKPQQNTMSINSYTYEQEYIIHNVGYRGLLPSKVDMKKQI